jgi:hypothetical protein
MKMTEEQAQAVINALNQAFDATIQKAQSRPPLETSELILDLSVARPRNNPFPVSFPFTTIYIEETNNPLANIFFIANDNVSIEPATRLSLKDALRFPNGVRKAFLYWDAQPGRTIKIKFYVTAQIELGSTFLTNQSQTQNINIGAATFALDGLTAVYSFAVGAAAPNTVFGAPSLVLHEASNNTLTPDGVSGNRWTVPKGFTARLVAAEMQLGATVLAPFPILLRARAIPAGGAPYVSDAAMIAASTNPCNLEFTTNAANSRNVVFPASDAGVFDEEQMIGFSTTTNITAWSGKMAIMFRLTPKVRS